MLATTSTPVSSSSGPTTCDTSTSCCASRPLDPISTVGVRRHVLQGMAWREGLGRYERFVRERGSGHVLLLELGVGEMTPGIITLPFWSMAAKLPDAHLLSVNISGGSAPLQLGSKAEAIQADLGTLLSAARAGDELRYPSRRVSSRFGALA